MDKPTFTLFVSNLPHNITSTEFEGIFNDAGPVKRCFIVKQKGTEKGRGFGYVTFSLHQDAETVLKEGRSYLGKKLIVKQADKKLPTPSNKPNKASDNVSTTIAATKAPKLSDEEKEKKKAQKKLFKLKKHRLIVRNLSFKANEKDVRAKFGKLGKIADITIPTKSNGNKKGFCFLQFNKMASAVKALKEMNGCEVKGRRVALDWSVSKQEYGNRQQQAPPEKTVEKESESESDSCDDSPDKSAGSKPKEKPVSKSKSDKDTGQKSKIGGDKKEQENKKENKKRKQEETKQNKKRKMEQLDLEKDSSPKSGSNKKQKSLVEKDSETSNANVKSKKTALKNDSEIESDSDFFEGDDQDMESDDDNDDDSFDGSEGNNGSSDTDDSNDFDEKPKAKKSNLKPDDVGEGRTIFVRNISYDTEEEDLEESFSKWGEINYVMLVIDKKTLHPKGTAFIKYNTAESAQKCIEECKNTPLIIDSRTLVVFPAMKSNDVVQLKAGKEEENKKQKDGRNIWLARMGTIRQGTQEAANLTASDIAKRAKIEVVKKQKLKDLNIFVSTTRLCVHNIPVSCDNKKLKEVFLKAVGDKEAKVTECRIMCDMTQVNSKGVAKSRGYGFVNFAQHKHALDALNKVNNNPDIFGDKKKPIVEFSLENRLALAAKEKRMERIQVKHAMLKGTGKQATYTKILKQQKERKENEEVITAPKTATKAMASHTGPKIRHKARQPQPNSKKSKKNKPKKEVKIREKKVKSNPGKSAASSDAFDSLVAKYKKAATSNMSSKKTGVKNASASKWFQ